MKAERYVISALFVLLLQTTAVRASADDDRYVLGPGDVVSIKFSGGKSTIAPVLPNGTTVVDHAGTVETEGLSIHELTEIINERFRKGGSEPSAEISLEQRRPMQAYVLGAVLHPGIYSLQSKNAEWANRDSLGTQGVTLTSVIELAGGPKPTADLEHVNVTRLQLKTIIHVDLTKLSEDGNMQQNFVLKSGDVVFVPIRGSINDDSGDPNRRVIRRPIAPVHSLPSCDFVPPDFSPAK